MLCLKIIVTKEDMTCADAIADFLNTKGFGHRTRKNTDSAEFEVDTDDEGLYSICCELTRYIRSKIIKPQILKTLTEDYGCFNSDETGIIVSNVFAHDFMNEIPGRMYVYFKINGAINPFAFYRFMCADTPKLIGSVTRAEADRILSVNDNSDFVDLLKCFADISLTPAERIEITADRDGIRITDCSSDIALNMTEYGCCDADVLAELVTMNPKKIEIKGKEEFLKTELSGVITAVFEDRIQYK